MRSGFESRHPDGVLKRLHNMKEDALFYVGQKAFIKKADEVLVILIPNKRLDYPGGKIQEGETDLGESFKREVKEETGLEIVVERPFTTWLHTFPSTHKLAGKQVFLVGYRCEYVSGEIKLEHVTDTFSWVTKDDYVKLNDGSAYFTALDKYFTLD